jgi:hypothetical protein
MSASNKNSGVPKAALNLLAQAALAPEHEALVAWRRWRRDYDIDTTPWNEVRMLGAVAARIDWLEPDAAIRPRISGIRKFLWVKSQICLKNAIEGLAVLDRVGMPTLLMKGAARIACDAAAAQERLIRDVDVLVPLGSEQKAFDALEAHGWSLADVGWQAPLRQWGGTAAHHAWALTKCDSEIDLHHFSNFLNRLKGDDDGIWRRARRICWRGANVYVPSPADALLIALIHGVRWSIDSAADWTIDASSVLDEGILDWDVFLEEARARMLQAVLVAGLQYLRDILKKTVPSEVLNILQAEATALQEAELAYYANTIWPETEMEKGVAWSIAAQRAMLRSGVKPLATGGNASLHIVGRTMTVLKPGETSCAFKIPYDRYPGDRVTARLEITLPDGKLGSRAVGGFRAPGLPLGRTSALVAQNADGFAVAKFQIGMPKALLELRQIQILQFRHLPVSHASEIGLARPAKMEWLAPV